MGRIKLTREERERLLQSIDEAQAKLADVDEDSLTEEEALSLLRECFGDVLSDILRAHKKERLLN
jgi:hypothetical protein